MKIKPAIRTEKEIDQIVAGFSGTWIKRRNVRNKLIEWSNNLVTEEIELQRWAIRRFKLDVTKEINLRRHYAEITKLERMLL